MSRTYLIFGSDDEVNWELLDRVQASGAPQALNKARERENHRHYSATPERNWAQGQPEVEERAPVVKWKMKKVDSDQMTVDDVLAVEEAIKETSREGVL